MMRAGETRWLESYALSTQKMTGADVPRLHELSVGVGWMHRPEDWQTAIALGEGLFAADEIGRIVGSAMWFPVSEDFATVGMVITTPRLQEHGAARWLMESVLEKAGARDLSLNATRAAYRLYVSLGFTPGPTVFQHQGPVTAPPPPPIGTRPMRAEDEPAVRALDHAAFGAERRALLDRILPRSAGVILERDGAAAGYALCRRFGRGHVVGPVVATSEADAIALVAAHLAARPGAFLRCDTAIPGGAFREFLAAAGLRLNDTVTSMHRGRQRQPAEGPRIMALASQAFG